MDKPAVKDINDIVIKILDIYKEADDKIRDFKEITGLKCPEGCGHCCEKAELETTVMEFLPLAVNLWKNDEAELWLDKLRKLETPSVCVFYEPDPHTKGNGRCRVYPWRGLICRLFGSFGMKGKDGTLKLVACSVIKKSFPGKVEETQNKISSGIEAPLITAFSYRLICLDPGMGRTFLPVNLAIRSAIEKIGLNRDLVSGTGPFPGGGSSAS